MYPLSACCLEWNRHQRHRDPVDAEDVPVAAYDAAAGAVVVAADASARIQKQQQWMHADDAGALTHGHEMSWQRMQQHEMRIHAHV